MALGLAGILLPEIAMHAQLALIIGPDEPLFQGEHSVLTVVVRLLGHAHGVYALSGAVLGILAIVIPLVKDLLHTIAWLRGDRRLRRWAAGLQKWSMLEVYALGVLLTYLVINATSGQGGGVVTVQKAAELRPGFWFLVAYSMISAALTYMPMTDPKAVKRVGKMGRGPWLMAYWLLTATSLGVLYLGLTETAVHLESVVRVVGQDFGSAQTRSVISAIDDLLRQGALEAAVLVFSVSVLIPLIKMLIMSTVVMLRGAGRIVWWLGILGKWSMAEAFGLLVLYALLDYQGSGLSGYLRTNLELQSGYFFFVSFCLLSIASLYLVRQCSFGRLVTFETPVPRRLSMRNS